jgi:hypothetical protein
MENWLNFWSRPNVWLRIARLVAFSFIIFCLLIFAGGVLLYPSFAASNPDRFLAWDWTRTEMESILSRVGQSFDWWIQFNLVVAVLFAFFQCSIAFLILLKKKNDWFSLYVATAFVFFSTQSGYPSVVVADKFPFLKPVLLPMGVYSWLSILLIFYAFPDGRFVPSWISRIAGMLVVGYTIDIVVYQGKTPPPPLLLLMFVLIGIGVANQFYRYRRVSTPFQRQQTKWVIFALLVVFITLMTIAIPVVAGGPVNPASPVALLLLFMAGSTAFILGLIPLSIALAILRYRLWDIDVIIRRTLVYSILTAALALVYFGSVALLEGVLRTFTGQAGQSPFAMVLSTLAIAALFNPLRKRIQVAIDRRFYRHKYDAERTLQAFAATMRDEVDLEQLSDHLVAAVQETMKPESVSLWLKPDGGVKQ